MIAVEKSVNDYTTKPSASLDDYALIGKYGTTYKITYEKLLANLREGKLQKYFGEENEGKALAIDDEGNVMLAEIAYVILRLRDSFGNIVGEHTYAVLKDHEYNITPPDFVGPYDDTFFEYTDIEPITGFPTGPINPIDTGCTPKPVTPTGIKIVKPPTKTKYLDFDELLFDGMKVKLLFSDSSKTYDIPLKELLYPKVVAEYDWSEYPDAIQENVPVEYKVPDTDTKFTDSFTITVNYEPDFLPVQIEVITPPTKVEYNDGESLDFTDAVVRAYQADGQWWVDKDHPRGIIPISELTLTPSKADCDDATGEITRTYPAFIGQGNFPATIVAAAVSLETNINGEDEREYLECNNGYVAMLVNKESRSIYDRLYVSYEPTTGRWCRQYKTPWEIWGNVSVTDSFTYDGKTVYCWDRSSGLMCQTATGGLNYATIGGMNSVQAAWTVLFGEAVSSVFKQTIDVSWTTPMGNVLTTSVEIGVLGCEVPPPPTEPPARIEVITPPTKTEYEDGETIDYTGMVVKAYDENDEPWTQGGHTDGIIPISELTLTDVADLGNNPNYRTEGTPGYVDGLEMPSIAYVNQLLPAYINREKNERNYTIYSYADAFQQSWLESHDDSENIDDDYVLCNSTLQANDVVFAAYVQYSSGNTYWIRPFMVSSASFNASATRVYKEYTFNTKTNISKEGLGSAESYTYNGKTVYWNTPYTSSFNENSKCELHVVTTDLDEYRSTHSMNNANTAKICWYILYGDLQPFSTQSLEIGFMGLTTTTDVTVIGETT